MHAYIAPPSVRAHLKELAVLPNTTWCDSSSILVLVLLSFPTAALPLEQPVLTDRVTWKQWGRLGRVDRGDGTRLDRARPCHGDGTCCWHVTLDGYEKLSRQWVPRG